MVIISFSIVPFALGKQRKTYLTEFLLDAERDDEGFSNSKESDDKISSEATAYALEILDHYQMLETKDWLGEIEHEVNTTDLQEYLEDKAKSQFSSGQIDIYGLYYYLKSLVLFEQLDSDYEISSTLEIDLRNYLDASDQSGNGFGPSSASIPFTYFAMMIYELMEAPIPNTNSHKEWIKSCINADGGFGGNTTLPSTIINTFYAIVIFEEVYDVDDLPNKGGTIDYLNSFYVDDESDEDNYGGYLPDFDAKNALLSSTYYCIKGISLIDNEEFEDEDLTLNWVKNRQNFKDGGFSDNSDGYEQKSSSVTTSYFAYKTIMIIDGIESPVLEEKVFMLEFIWIDWAIFVIILSILGAAAISAVIIWRKRRI